MAMVYHCSTPYQFFVLFLYDSVNDSQSISFPLLANLHVNVTQFCSLLHSQPSQLVTNRSFVSFLSLSRNYCRTRAPPVEDLIEEQSLLQFSAKISESRVKHLLISRFLT